MLGCDSPLNRFASATLGNDSMTLQKAPPTTALNRTDSPRRETLRRELARSKPTGRRAASSPSSCSPALARPPDAAGQVGIEPDALRPSASTSSPARARCHARSFRRLARAKAEVARDQIANDKDIAGAYVLAADTIVAVGRRILGKPRSWRRRSRPCSCCRGAPTA